MDFQRKQAAGKAGMRSRSRDSRKEWRIGQSWSLPAAQSKNVQNMSEDHATDSRNDKQMRGSTKDVKD